MTRTNPSRARPFKRAAALAALALGLSGCVVYPSNGYYGGGYGYAPAYYAPPVVGSVVIGGGCCWGGGWGGHRWR